MSVKVVGAEDLAVEISAQLGYFKGATLAVLEEATEQVAKETARQIESNAVSAGIGGKKYIKSWTSKKQSRGNVASRIVYSKLPMLSHLLEDGHHIVYVKSGSRVHGGRTRSFPHIRKAKEWAQRRFMDVCAQKISEIK